MIRSRTHSSTCPWRLPAVTLLVVLIVAGAVVRGEAIPPLPALQSHIDDVVGVIVDASASPQSGSVAIAIDDLEEAAAEGAHGTFTGRTRLLAQLVLYIAGADGTERAMGSALLLHRLAFTFEEKIAAVVPHLETTDEAQRQALHDLLSTIDRVDGSTPDFTPYERLLNTPGTVADRLTLYMYEVDPMVAVRVLQGVHGTTKGHSFTVLQQTLAGIAELAAERDRGRVWTVAQRDTYQGHLQRLGASSSWWIRLYAGAMTMRYPTPDDDVLGHLRDDVDPRVRAFVSRGAVGPLH